MRAVQTGGYSIAHLIPHSVQAERIPALAIEHFQQNGNIKNIAHIDDVTNHEFQLAEPNKRPNGGDVDVEAPSTPPPVALNDVETTMTTVAATAAPTAPTVAAAAAEEKEVIEVEIIPKGYSLIRFPKEKSCFRKVMWFVLWPIHFLFMLTIPDCERPSLKKLFPITFLMCIVWIASLSYMVAWMITIIGEWRGGGVGRCV